MEREPDGGFACELVLNGRDGNVRAGAPAALGRRLTEHGAVRVVPVYAARPAPGRRSSGMVDVATLAVTSAGALVAIIDTVRGWLSEERNAPAPDGADGADGAGRVASITVIMGDDKVEIIQPSTTAEQRLVDAFVRRHTPS
ncbi:effector-associated constant component EACC1 [Streptomyces phaeolivaceus]|uniref:effector-associated constant component EACC1 n=1 Tax=Streptomyces phaeolivaceus TaxID=2653200 RepID=UPI001D054A38|nr:hypothetical protein [Streptomyces phaeolivaceus]